MPVNPAVEKATLRLAAFRTGGHPYDRPLGDPPKTKRVESYTAVKLAARRASAAELLMRRRVALIATHADALLDTNLSDLREALRGRAQWDAATEHLAKAQEAIAMLQAEVARMVPR